LSYFQNATIIEENGTINFLGVDMKFLVLFSLFFVVSCGSEILDRRDQPQIDLPQLPPPIPPIYRQEPNRPPVNPPQQPQTPLDPEPAYTQADYDRHLQAARRQYPQIIIQEDMSSNARATVRYGRYYVIMGRGLRSTLPPDSYALVLHHEISHILNRGRRQLSNEVLADWYGMQRLRYSLMKMRKRHDKRRLKTIARRNTRMLKRKRGKRYAAHPDPDCRYLIYDAAIENKGIPYCANKYM